MAGRLSSATARMMGGNGVVAHSSSSLRSRAGISLPVGKHIVPEKLLPVHDEMIGDNGTLYPEPCIDRLAPNISMPIPLDAHPYAVQKFEWRLRTDYEQCRSRVSMSHIYGFWMFWKLDF